MYLPAKFKGMTDAGTLEAELKAAAELTIAEMDDLGAAGFQLHEAWAMARESHLILPEEEPVEEEPMPDNPAFDAIADCNSVLRQLGNE